MDRLEGAPVEGILLLLGLRIRGDVEVLAIVPYVVISATTFPRTAQNIRQSFVSTDGSPSVAQNCHA